MKYLLLALLFISGCSITGFVVSEPKLEGPFLVTNVVDGDTLDLDNSERVRFSGINTPETGECYYSEAKEKLSELVLNKKVYLEKDISDRDKYGRLLRYIYLNETNLILVNGVVVESGHAKVYDKYKDDTKRYSELKQLEAQAISNKLGVWSCEDLKKTCLFVSSKNSDKYHTPSCKFAKKILPSNLVCHTSEPSDKEFSGC